MYICLAIFGNGGSSLRSLGAPRAGLSRVLPVAVLALTVGVLAGCVNPYAQYYRDQLEGRPIQAYPELIPFDGEPEFVASGDPEKDERAFLANGYVMIGFAIFDGGFVDRDEAIGQARSVGAAAVVVHSELVSTLTRYMPYSVHHPPRVYTTYQSGTVTGPGGTKSYTRRSTTVADGGYSTYQVPYSVNRYHYNATFWIMARPPILGIHVQDLSDTVRREIGSNSGVVAYVVVKGSPAFRADIMAGDVITTINGQAIGDSEEFSRLVEEQIGQEVVLATIRDGDRRDVTVRILERDEQVVESKPR